MLLQSLFSILFGLAIAQKCTTVTSRKEISDMTPADWTVFQQTISKSQQTPDLEFTDLSIWEAAAALHNNLNYEIHGTCYFLPWHRLFLAVIERRLQTINPKFFFPYFASDRDPKNFTASPIWKFIGGFGMPVTNDLFSARPLKYGSSSAPLARRYNTTAAMPFKTQYDDIYQTSLTHKKFDTYASQIFNIHGYMHNAMTGPMGTMFSPLDPLFYLHHSFIDYTWTQGQSGWAAKGWPLSAQFGGEKMDGSSCAMTDKLPGYVNQVSEVIDTASLCILYSVPVVSSQIAQPNPANATCPPPLSATWIAMQEAGNKNKGDVLKADQLMFTRCQALLNQAKKNITVPPMPEVSDKDRTFVSDTPLSPPPVADVERATGGAVGSQVSVTLLAVILVISAL